MKKAICIVALCLAAPFAAPAQAPATNAVTTTAQRLLERFTRNLMGTAQVMPADKYGYSPTPAEMAFGATIGHIAEVNNFSCSKFADVPMPQTKTSESDSKEKLIAALKESFDYCKQTMDKLDDAKLEEPITFFGGRQATRAAAVFELLDDLSDHYASLSVYLRLNGLLPPSAQPKK